MPSRKFEMDFQSLSLGGKEYSDITLEYWFDEHAELRFRFNVDLDPIEKLQVHDSLAKIVDRNVPDGISLIPIGGDSGGVLMLPTIAPVVFDFNRKICRVEAVFLNSPSSGWGRDELRFNCMGAEMRYREYSSCKEFKENKRGYARDTLATSSVLIEGLSYQTSKRDEIVREVRNFSSFLAFVRGGLCGLGNIVGRDENGEVSFAYLGFGPTDPFFVESGWCDEDLMGAVPALFDKYRQEMKDEERAGIIRRTVNFYRASNRARESSTSVALVASYAALETIVPYLLSKSELLAGLSANEVKSLPFSSKIRMASDFVASGIEPFQHCIKLSERLLSQTEMDAFELLAYFRNKTTHYKKSFRYDGMEMLEAWQATQWLCEIFIFYLLGYDGKFSDRRRYGGWKVWSEEPPFKWKLRLL